MWAIAELGCTLKLQPALFSIILDYATGAAYTHTLLVR